MSESSGEDVRPEPNFSVHQLRSSSSVAARRGSALLPALGFVIVLAMLSAVVLSLSSNRHGEIKSDTDAKRAFYIAEAGFAESMLGLVTGRSGNVGSDLEPARFADGIFWVSVEDAGKNKLTLKSTGLCGRGRVALSIVVEKVHTSVASLGFFGGKSVTVESGCTIDSFDSRLGTTALSTPTARVGSNESIEVQGALRRPTLIQGDATPGPESAVVRKAHVKITGSTTPLEQTIEMPEIEAPELPRDETRTYAQRKKPVVLPPGEYGFRELRVTSSAKLTILGPSTIVTDVLRVDAGSSLVLDGEAGPIKIYALDRLALESGSTVTTPALDPAAVAMLITASETKDRDGNGVVEPPVTIGAKSQFHGTIYAPAAALTLPASFEVFGSAAGLSLQMLAGSRLHFDVALKDVGGEDEGLPHLSCWRIVELPPVKLVKDRGDPFTTMIQDGIEPVDSKDAHYGIGVVPPSSDPTLVPYTAGLPGLRIPGEEESAEEEPTPGEAALMARIDLDPPLNSSDLKSELIAAGPLTDRVLKKAIHRVPDMDSSDLKDVLLYNDPLGERILNELFKRSIPMNKSDLKDVLIGSSPLPSNPLGALLGLVPLRLSLSDYLSVLAAQ